MNKSVLEKDREFTKKILDTINFEMVIELQWQCLYDVSLLCLPIAI